MSIFLFGAIACSDVLCHCLFIGHEDADADLALKRNQREIPKMAFQKINKAEFRHSGRGQMVNTVRMSPVSKTSSKSVFITISRDVHEMMGAPTRVHFLVGSGEDAGLVQIVPALSSDTAAYKLTRYGTKASAVKATVTTKALGCPVPDASINMAFNIDSKGITIRLPKPRQHLNQMATSQAWGLQAAE